MVASNVRVSPSSSQWGHSSITEPVPKSRTARAHWHRMTEGRASCNRLHGTTKEFFKERPAHWKWRGLDSFNAKREKDAVPPERKSLAALHMWPTRTGRQDRSSEGSASKSLWGQQGCLTETEWSLVVTRETAGWQARALLISAEDLKWVDSGAGLGSPEKTATQESETAPL